MINMFLHLIFGYQTASCFKVDLSNLNRQWQEVSIEMPITEISKMPTFDLVNNEVIALTDDGKFYYYYSDSNIKELVGLSYQGNYYRRTLNQEV